jgi:hypothetical protein
MKLYLVSIAGGPAIRARCFVTSLVLLKPRICAVLDRFGKNPGWLIATSLSKTRLVIITSVPTGLAWTLSSLPMLCWAPRPAMPVIAGGFEHRGSDTDRRGLDHRRLRGDKSR